MIPSNVWPSHLCLHPVFSHRSPFFICRHLGHMSIWMSCQAMPQVHSKPDTAASFPNFLPKVALVSLTSPHSLGPAASGLSCLCVSSPATSPHSLGPFQSCRGHDSAVLLEVTCVCILRPAIVVGCLYCLFI